jgi:hypothetical protein
MLRNALLARTKTYDTSFGPLVDCILNPVAAVLEDQNNSRLLPVSQLLSLENSTAFSDSDLDATVFNEDIIRPSGSYASTVLTFSRSRPFSTSESGLIPAGYPVATSPDETTGTATIFVTSESRDKTSAIAVLDPTTSTTVYQLQVPATALVKGSQGLVGPGRITDPQRPLVGYDSVTNEVGTQDGADTYTNAQLIDLYLLAVSSRQLSVPTGSEFYVRSNFASVQDVNEVFGTNPLLTRAASDAGAVDSYIVGNNNQTLTDQIVFLGVGQKLVVSTPPVVSITTVSRVSDGYVFIEGTDYNVTLDTGGNAGSIRALDGITFLPGANLIPTIGDIISITYLFNQLIIDLQSDADSPDVQVEGRDLLFKMGIEVPIYFAATLSVSSGYSASSVQLAVQNAVLGYVNALGLGDTVEAFGIDSAVAGVSGVSNFVITLLTSNPLVVSTGDVAIGGDSFPSLDLVNMSLTIK